jgi:hypothetical protein
MYAVTSTPFVKRTRAILRNAEFGFLGVIVFTAKQTPRRWGHPVSAGDLLLERFGFRPTLISWFMVGICLFPCFDKQMTEFISLTVALQVLS